MSNLSASTSSGGVGLFGLTFVALLVLKLTGLAQLTWFWVFFPLMVAFGLSLFILLVVAVVFILAAIFG